MTEPLSITGSVVAVAGLAYSSGKVLYELISTIRDAPSLFQDLNQDINTLNYILNTLKTNLPNHGATRGEAQLACSTAMKQTLQGCNLACKAFKDKVDGLTLRSQDGKRSFRDGAKLKFQSKSIEDFRAKVNSWKVSLALALDVALLATPHSDKNALDALENKMTAARDQITVSLKQVNTRLDKLLAIELESEEDLQMIAQKKANEEQHKLTLIQCLSLCQAAADGATQMTGHSFKNNRLLGEAKAIYGDVGQPGQHSKNHNYDGNEANNKTRAVYGNVDGESLATFMGNISCSN